MSTKVVVIGKGTAGAQSISHFLKYMPDSEIEWHFDPNIKPQAVGEGSTLNLPDSLYKNLEFYHTDLEKINGTPKYGVYKENWGSEGRPFFHPFVNSNISYHFNAIGLQNYVFEKVKDKVKIVEHNTSSEHIDADFVMDCSGKPPGYDPFNVLEDMAVNSVYVTQCYWDHPTFFYTLAIARPYGWVFGIPLTNRCSIGYMYNNNLNTLEEVKLDVQEIFKQWKLTPSLDTNSFSFKSYYRNNNFNNRIAYNGNASFFLEPLEATSINFMEHINRAAFDVWTRNFTVEEGNNYYTKYIEKLKTIILLHYINGSSFKTPFWENAEYHSNVWINSRLVKDQDFKNIIEVLKTRLSDDRTSNLVNLLPEYGNWWVGSFKQHILGLGLSSKFYN